MVDWIKNRRNVAEQDISSAEERKAVTAILPTQNCIGCGACVSICPVDALHLVCDEDGYYRAEVDEEKCINCGKCVKVCPALKLPEKTNRKQPKCYEFIAADLQVLQNSTSGGIFPLLAQEAFRRKGSVVGAAWREDFSVAHIMIDREQDLPKLQKSKYLQSYLGNTFRQVEKTLKNGVFVLFSGCPCQVAGLISYLGKEYDNLLTVDLLCGNAPSTRFFQEYLREQFPEGLRGYEFRNKKAGWNASSVLITQSNGMQLFRSRIRDDDYQRVYHNHTMCAPHCEGCKYQNAPRFGDITIGDFWGIGGKDPSIDTQKGVSLVLSNNQKGDQFLSAIPKSSIALLKEVPLSWVGGNGFITGGRNFASPARDEFYKAIKKMPFSQAANFVLKPNHGISPQFYRDSRTLLQYDSRMLRFHFNTNVWEEHFIHGTTMLFSNQANAKAGNYAMMSLSKLLEKGKTYRLSMRMKINTQSPTVNFHIKDSGSNLFQVIYVHNVKKEMNGRWTDISVDFKPDSHIYDEFMIGAAQFRGENAYIGFDYINIQEI